MLRETQIFILRRHTVTRSPGGKNEKEGTPTGKKLR
jgi:hypothetical protein